MKPTELGRPHSPATKPLLSGQKKQLCQKGTQPTPGCRGREAGGWQVPRPGTRLPGLPIRDQELGRERTGTPPAPATPAPVEGGGGARFLDNRAGAQPFLWAGGGEGAKGPLSEGSGGPSGTCGAQQPRVRMAGRAPTVYPRSRSLSS